MVSGSDSGNWYQITVSQKLSEVILPPIVLTLVRPVPTHLLNAEHQVKKCLKSLIKVWSGWRLNQQPFILIKHFLTQIHVKNTCISEDTQEMPQSGSTAFPRHQKRERSCRFAGFSLQSKYDRWGLHHERLYMANYRNNNKIKALTALVGRLSLSVGWRNGPEQRLRTISFKS